MVALSQVRCLHLSVTHSNGGNLIVAAIVGPPPNRYVPPYFTGFSHLTCLSIHSSYLFRNPVLPWIIRVINGAPLTSLAITNTGVSQRAWSDILPQVLVHSLTSLKLDGDFSIIALAKFLNHHPSIHTLDLGRTRRLWWSDDIPNVSLPKLANLTGTLMACAGLIYKQLPIVNSLVEVDIDFYDTTTLFIAPFVSCLMQGVGSCTLRKLIMRFNARHIMETVVDHVSHTNT